MPTSPSFTNWWRILGYLSFSGKMRRSRLTQTQQESRFTTASVNVGCTRPALVGGRAGWDARVSASTGWGSRRHFISVVFIPVRVRSVLSDPRVHVMLVTRPLARRLETFNLIPRGTYYSRNYSGIIDAGLVINEVHSTALYFCYITQLKHLQSK